MGKNVLTIKCETPLILEAIKSLFINHKRDIIRLVGGYLAENGEASDPKVVVQDGVVTITKTSGDKGTVFTVVGGDLVALKYEDVLIHQKYFEVKEGSILTYVKKRNGIDIALARYGELSEAVADFDSNKLKEVFDKAIDDEIEKNNEEAVMLIEKGGETDERGEITE